MWGPVRQLSGFRCQLLNFRLLLQDDLGRSKYICIGDKGKAIEFLTSYITFCLTVFEVQGISVDYSVPPGTT
jgi:hypothetical protein